MEVWYLLLYENTINGSFLFQDPLKSITQARNMSFNVWMALSDWPSVWGWNVILNLSCVHYAFCTHFWWGETSISIKNNRNRYTMEYYIGYLNLNQYLHWEGDFDQYEMSRFGQSVHNDLNCIVTFSSPWYAYYEILRNLLQLLFREFYGCYVVCRLSNLCI